MVVAGVDVGSTYTKAVLLDVDGVIAGHSILKTDPDFDAGATRALAEAAKAAELSYSDIRYLVSTGYGRARVSFADSHATEIICHGRGAANRLSGIHTIIDIGGQDAKAIQIDDRGRVTNFIMNDRCAAGTGRFLEVIASALWVEMDEMAILAAQSTEKLEVSSTCTVFAESEVISLLAGGCNKADIAAAIYRAICSRVASMVRRIGVREQLAMTGGVAKNLGVVRGMQENLETRLHIPEEPQIIGALGAALIAGDRSRAARGRANDQ